MADDQRQVAGVGVDLDRLRQFYAARGAAPVWTDEAAAREVARTLADAGAQGLSPRSYHVQLLADFITPPETAAKAAAKTSDSDENAARRLDQELLLTDGLLRYVRDLRVGRLAPQRINRELDIDPPVIDAVAMAAGVIAAPSPAAALQALAPANADYVRLRKLLAQLRQSEQNGGWPLVIPSKGRAKLESGVTDPAVAVLRDRLAASGDYTGPRGAKLQTFDGALKAAVVRFQTRHGLTADGVVAEATLSEINTPAQTRIDQVSANMERARWLPDNLGERHIRVNVPDYKLTAVDDGRVARTMRVIVGAKNRKTPMLSSVVTSVVLNPTWTMPPRLAREDYLPKLLKNPSYLAEHGFTVYTGWGADAKRVDARKINWKSTGASGIAGLRLRQDPGPQNALGQIKFNINNDFDIYLHDTPSRDKFQRSMRALSSGCVRLGEPMALADFVLTDMPEWGAPQRQTVLDSQKTRFITLKRPTPVHILYQTVWVDDDGVVQFRPDIYERDGELLAAVARAAAPSGAPAKLAMNTPRP